MALAAVVVLGAALTAGLVLGLRWRHAARHASWRLELASAVAGLGAPGVGLERFGEALCDLLVPAAADLCALDVVVGGALLRQSARCSGDDAEGARATLLAQPPVAAERCREAERELLRAPDVRSVVVAPLEARGETLGALTLAVGHSGRRFTRADAAFAEELARRAALAIDNERLHAERAEVATMLQASLMPARLPRIPGWTLSAIYRPGGREDEVVVAGDFYDAFEVGDGWMLLVGDVAGHGVAAAAVTGRVRYAARTAALGGRGPAEVLRVVNRVLRAGDDPATCTAVCLQLPVSRPGTVIVASAGHPLPYVVGARGLMVTATTGTLLGAIDRGRWPESRVALAPGDTVVAFTDGVTETPGRAERFGEHRLVELLERADPDPARLVRHADDVLDRFWDGAARDDTLLLAARYAGGGA